MALSSAAIRLAQSFYFFVFLPKETIIRILITFYVCVGRFRVETNEKFGFLVMFFVVVVVVIRTAATHNDKRIQALSLFPIASVSVGNA